MLKIKGIKHKVKDITQRNKETYQIYKNINKRFPRNKVITSYKNDQWDIDLVDMTYFAKKNKNMKYLLTIIDIFSRFGYAIPIKSKSESDVYAALTSIINNQKNQIIFDLIMELSSKE